MEAKPTRPCDNDVVLIVEDDPDVREAISLVLSEEGYSVAWAEHGRKALEYLRENPPPCLILMDVYMPVMNGEELRAELLRDPRWAGIPCVLVTAARDGSTLAHSLCAAGYLPKPLSLDDLISVVGANC